MILKSIGFCSNSSAQARSLGEHEEQSPTIKAGSHDATVVCLQGNGIDQADTAGCNGKGWKENQCYTLNTIDRPAVAYGIDSLSSNSMKFSNPHSGFHETDIAKCLDTSDGNPCKNQGGMCVVQECYGIGNDQANQSVTEEKAATLNCMDARPMVCDSIDCRNAVLNEDHTATLQAHNEGGFSLNATHPVLIYEKPHYIVRRLTPTECARLQGFPDFWQDIDILTDLTDEEMVFWQNVRDTYAEINGKQKKKYTKEQLIKWHNGLQTDSAIYKMYGNGVALPNVLYVMEGIAEVFKKERM